MASHDRCNAAVHQVSAARDELGFGRGQKRDHCGNVFRSSAATHCGARALFFSQDRGVPPVRLRRGVGGPPPEVRMSHAAVTEPSNSDSIQTFYHTQSSTETGRLL